MNFYFEAGKVLDKIDAKQGSIKGILATVNPHNRKRMSAVVIRTLEYKVALLDVIEASQLLKSEKKLIPTTSLALVLVHDLLFSKGIEAADGPVKQAVLRHKTRLHSELVKLKVKKGVKDNKDLARSEQPFIASIPRYVRVNPNVGTIENAKSALELKRNLRVVPNGEEVNDPRGFSLDPNVPNLLALHPSVSLQLDVEYASGLFILQDKASCLPATILQPPRNGGAVVIDATAAPGNKTSHLSALMGNIGTIFAFERDKRRFKTLEKMLAKANCQNVRLTRGDFLETDPMDSLYAGATHMLLDPSCSGSGIVNRLDYLVESENGGASTQSDRLQKLAEFQLSMIRHAMKFPSMQKIVYSTCSVHAEENEHVIMAALRGDEGKWFRLAPRSDVLPDWPRRGLQDEVDGSVEAEHDRTNGFFVACIVRTGGAYDHDQAERIAPEKPVLAKRKPRDGDELDVGDVTVKPTRKKKKRKNLALTSSAL